MSYPNTVATLPGTWTYLRMRSAPITLQGDLSGWRASLGFRTTYANLANFVTSIAGTAATVTTGWGSMSRVFRMQHPEYTALYATSIRTEATGESSGTAFNQMYSDVKVIVDFASPTYDFTSDTAFMTLDMDQSAQYTTAPGRKFKFPSGEPIDQEAGAFATLNTYTLTVFNCPSLNNTAIDLCAASPVNAATFLGYAPGYLLFGGCKSVYSTTMGNVTTFQKSLSFTYRSYPWNQAYQHNGVLDTPLDPASNPLYNTSNFYTMLG